ncbi:MAG TPA: hypothetical protein VLF14_00825 [Candidatus Binatia bacterium]|nr:hypothetical protein [Candidatus Binatia bacterium]
MGSIRSRRWIAAAALLCALAGPAAAKDYGNQAGWGFAAVLANLLYIPAKLVYATLGGVTGGLGYLLTAGNGDVAEKILAPSVGGTYVLTPDMLRGEQPILFSGEGAD